jgi:hypothetical protein
MNEEPKQHTMLINVAPMSKSPEELPDRKDEEQGCRRKAKDDGHPP